MLPEAYLAWVYVIGGLLTIMTAPYIGRLDLIGWLDEAQRSSQQWSQRFYRLLSDFGKWHQHVQDTRKTEESSSEDLCVSGLRNFFRLPDEILNAPDPIAAILESHRSMIKNEERDGN